MTLPQDDDRLPLELQAREEALSVADRSVMQDTVRDRAHDEAGKEYLRVFQRTFNNLPNNDAGMGDRVNKSAEKAMRAYSKTFHDAYDKAFCTAFDARPRDRNRRTHERRY